MVKGIFWLILSYGLSQFYRACLAVFAPVLKSEIGLGADQVSSALGVWFLCFAAMQIPVGWLLDHSSPKRMASLLLFAGGGLGALIFAMAQSPWHISLAMGLIGIGCSPVLMTGYYVVAREAPPERFGTLAGLILGIGSLGNLAASAPLSLSLSWIGWRGTMVVLAGITALVALALIRFVSDPPRIDTTSDRNAGLKDLLALRPLYPVLAIALVAYAPAAGLRGSWIGGYLADVYGLDASQIGNAVFYMAVAMIVGSLAFGPADRVIRSRKLLVGGSGALTVISLFLLWQGAGQWSVSMTVILFMSVGFFASNYPQIMNHGRSLLPDELVGRGVTLINLFSIGGVGLSQMATARVFAAGSGYQGVFIYFTLALAVGLIAYIVPTFRAKT